jgi:NAD(P)-dependent dehydrogenase (short-subunit alcohol dehydrogenase family)
VSERPFERREGGGLKNLFSVEGKVAVVTGGSRGIGEMIARGFVEAGARVYISSRKRDACEEVAAALSKSGSAIAVPADVGTEAGVKHLAAEIAKREPALHVLVNNAGANWGAPYAEFPESAWDKVLAVNLKAVFFLTRELTPLLEKGAAPGDPARVINIGSIDAIQVPPLETYAYSASKAAVHHMTTAAYRSERASRAGDRQKSGRSQRSRNVTASTGLRASGPKPRPSG